MFGFLAPARRIPEWRQSYARVCQFQRKLYGLTSLPFLSYEAAFLYRLAIDFELMPELPESAAECCRLKRLRDAECAPDYQAAKFAARSETGEFIEAGTSITVVSTNAFGVFVREKKSSV